MNKKIIYALLIFILVGRLSTSAQEVNTLYFLENAPMRHIVNPAFQPVSNGYINFSPLGYLSLNGGNNSLTMSDLIFPGPDGTTITALHPSYDIQDLLKKFRQSPLLDSEISLDLLSFGFRIKEKGFFHFNVIERVDLSAALPRDLFNFILGGGMTNLNGVTPINLTKLGINASAYTELGFGYSHMINDQWTFGGKLKALLGSAYIGVNNNNLGIDAAADEWRLHGNGNIYLAAPLSLAGLPQTIDSESINNMSAEDIVDDLTWKDFIKPAGGGIAIDLGMTYKPIEQLQVTASITDLGFIYWNKSKKYAYSMDTVFNGVGEFEYEDYVVDGKFSGDSLMSDVKSNLSGLLDNMQAESLENNGFARMVSAKLNVGLDANFWDNRVGVGVLSRTRFSNKQVYEEVTLGAAFRPCNWFNMAVSYSLLQNGKYSNIGAGISFMPYDGINLTMAMDYIPTSYAALPNASEDYITNADGTQTYIGAKPQYILPYKTKCVNVALGFSIVWGTNHKKNKDSDLDGIFDYCDICEHTPTNIKVDTLGCPWDSDGDGVPDYLDSCANTPYQAYGLTDSIGCELDTDGDGVPDWKDECAGTVEQARGFVDEKGCAKDSDGDGVPDWKDECPNTPEGAIGFTDDKGCEIDSDGDSVPDWRDECPNTPKEAIGYTDDKGCELDSDSDNVADWKDMCPNTPIEAKGYVDANGCELDTDKDGVPDWKDECPMVPGVTYNKGCPEIKKEVRTLLQKAMQGIEFDNGKATIKKSSYPLLDKIAQTFIENANFIIEVQGHTDNVGNAEYNKELSHRRAQSVRDYLIKHGVETTRMTANGYGMEKPIADNKTKAGRAKNRRVEFNITFEEIHYETILDHADSTLLPPQDTIVQMEIAK